MKKPFVSNLYWFPAKAVDWQAVEKHFTVTLDPKTKDVWREEQPETLHIYATRVANGKDWVGLPRGREDLVKRCLVSKKTLKNMKDRRVDKKAEIPLRMHGVYRPYQEKAIKEMVKHDTGVLTAPPRMGKTVMAIGMVIAKQRKTLIIAHQTDLLEQFLRQTIENKELFGGAFLSEPVAGICQDVEDFKKYAICLATYQTFLSGKGQRVLNSIKDMFGMVFIDENHRVPADRYSSILAKFSAKHMHGCTATPDRKDNCYVLADRLLGPIRHSIGREDVMSPKVYGHETRIKLPPRVPKTWNGLLTMLYSNKKRNAKIARAAAFDVSNGHHVLIPVNRQKWANELEELINKQVGKKVCFMFNGSIPKNKRQEARDIMRFDDDVKVTIATRSMLLGMDCPDWSAIYTVAPISNVPTYTQEVFRVCTPKEGKRRPIIRYFADSPLGMSYGCMVNCAKTLRNANNGFHLTQSYLDLLSKVGKKISRNMEDPHDDMDKTHRPNYGQHEHLGIKRF